MNAFHRLGDYVPEDEYVNIIGMIVSDIKRRRITETSYEWTFTILQDETSGRFDIKYRASKLEEDFQPAKLFNAIGSLIFMNRCVKNGLEYELDFEKDNLAIVALRPNEFQVQEFLKERL